MVEKAEKETKSKNKKKTKKLALDNKRTRRLSYKDKKRFVKKNEPISSGFTVLRLSVLHILRNKKLFAGIMLIYTILYLLLVRGIATSFQLPNTKEAIQNAGVEADTFTLGATLLGTMFGSVGSTSSESAAVYQVFLFLFISMVLIWTLRQTYSSRAKITVRQSFYSSMGQLVQFVIVWLFICIQLIPALIGVTIYSIVSANGIAVGGFENILWLIFLITFVSLSVYLVSSSLFATYIVSLPGMTPRSALKKAKLVVKFRRFAIIRKAVIIPLIVFLLSLLIFFPLVIFMPVLAEILFLIYTILLILFGHSYFYNLYKELI